MAKFGQFRIKQRTYIFHLRIGFFLLCCGFFILFCLLSLWQLHRYQDTKKLLAASQRLLAAPAQDFTKAGPNITEFQQIKTEGQYLNSLTILIQNRFYHDKIGYEVFTPFKMPGAQKLLLVDRGWIPALASQSTPEIKDVLGQQKISGYIKLMNDHPFILGKNILELNRLPLIMQKIDIDEVSRFAHQNFYNFILRLDPSEPNGFVRDWKITNMIPQRHLGYSIQWIVMAIVLGIAFILFSCERVKS